VRRCRGRNGGGFGSRGLVGRGGSRFIFGVWEFIKRKGENGWFLKRRRRRNVVSR